MVAQGEGSPKRESQASPLVCNCTRVVVRGDQVLNVKQRMWDCPSCGRDKQRILAEICAAADPDRMITFTLPQPVAVDSASLAALRREDPRYLRAPAYECFAALERVLGSAPCTPAEFVDCDPRTHLIEYVNRRGVKTLRWLTMGRCSGCCVRVSEMLTLWRKSMRRDAEGLEYLRAYEDHASGALHIHMAADGLPALGYRRGTRTRFTPAGAEVQRHWTRLGGGMVDPGHSDKHSARGVGWYIGKYLAKRHDQKMAHGFRRWSRTAGFGAEVRMSPPRAPAEDQVLDVELRVIGWKPPAWSNAPEGAVSNVRWWPPPG
jgi:hypothetical protein